jgi:hypothetical protein
MLVSAQTPPRISTAQRFSILVIRFPLLSTLYADLSRHSFGVDAEAARRMRRLHCMVYASLIVVPAMLDCRGVDLPLSFYHVLTRARRVRSVRSAANLLIWQNESGLTEM